MIELYGNAELIFKNCTFYESVNINHAHEITFENNKYILNSTCNKSFCISSRYIEDVECLKIINDNFINSFDKIISTNIGRTNHLISSYLNAKKVELINCDSFSNDTLRINTDKLILDNCSIKANEAYITAKEIERKNSNLVIKDGMIIENNESNAEILNFITSPFLIYNDEIIIDDDDENIKKERTAQRQLHEKRIELLNLLKTLKENCNKEVLEKLTKIKSNLNSNTISKTLKK